MNAIDTNILVYRVDCNEPTKQPIARELLHQLSSDHNTILLWQVLAEFARWLKASEHAKRIESTTVHEYLNAVRRELSLRMPNPSCLDIALDLASRYSLSHWDSMLVAACFEAGVTTLYTEDMGAPRKIDALELINPFLVNPKAS